MGLGGSPLSGEVIEVQNLLTSEYLQKMVTDAVDNFVTPQGIAAMVRSGETPEPERPVPADDTPAADKDKIRQSWAYRGLNTFAVTLTRDDRPDDALVLIMERRTPFTWKLAGVDLTPDPMG